MHFKPLFLFVILFFVSACGEPPSTSEEQIRAWLQAGQEAVEGRDRSAVMDMLSERYSDRRGNDRTAVGNQLRVIFLRQQSITLLTRIEKIDVFADSAAEVTMTVGMAGSNNSRLGFSADAKRFVLELERSGGDWQLISAQWGDVGSKGPGGY